MYYFCINVLRFVNAMQNKTVTLHRELRALDVIILILFFIVLLHKLNHKHSFVCITLLHSYAKKKKKHQET